MRKLSSLASTLILVASCGGDDSKSDGGQGPVDDGVPLPMDGPGPDTASPDVAVLPDGGADGPGDGGAADRPEVAVDAALAIDVAPREAPPPGPDVAMGATHQVKVRGEVLSFDPKALNIKVGDTVDWTWEAGGHSVVSGGKGGTTPGDCTIDGAFESGLRSAGETFSFTFTAADTFGYHCAAHCQQFEGGEIVVR